MPSKAQGDVRTFRVVVPLRRHIRANARKLQAFQERRLEQYEFVALVLDGKTFQDDTLVVALGITGQGEKVLMGFVETGTENETACAEFLQGLVERGLRYDEKNQREGGEQAFTLHPKNVHQ